MKNLLTYYFRPKTVINSNTYPINSPTNSTQLPQATLSLVRVSESGLQCTLSLFLQLKLGNGCTSFNPLSSDTLHMCVRACMCVCMCACNGNFGGFSKVLENEKFSPSALLLQ